MPTEEYTLFHKEVKKYIKDLLGDMLELVNWSKGHFEFSGFIRNKETQKLVYFSCSDVRHFPDSWYNDLLIRTAEDDKDYSGRSNDSCKITEIKEKAERLTV